MGWSLHPDMRLRWDRRPDTEAGREMGDNVVAPDYSPRRDEAYDYLVSAYPEWSEVAITVAGQAIEVGPRESPKSGSACRIRVAIVGADEVIYVVGHTQIEEASRRPMGIQDLLMGVVAWIEAARGGAIHERVSRKSGQVLKSVLQRADEEGRHRASEWSGFFLPWSATREEIHYQPYPRPS